jgi:hypothetical protein
MGDVITYCPLGFGSCPYGRGYLMSPAMQADLKLCGGKSELVFVNIASFDVHAADIIYIC